MTEPWNFLIKLGETALTVTIKGNMGTLFLTFLDYLLIKENKKLHAFCASPPLA